MESERKKIINFCYGMFSEEFFIQNVKITSKNFPLDTSNDPIRLVFLFSETYLDNSAALYFCLNPELGVRGT